MLNFENLSESFKTSYQCARYNNQCSGISKLFRFLSGSLYLLAHFNYLLCDFHVCFGKNHRETNATFGYCRMFPAHANWV
jgi:hypothetical protein